MWRVIIRLMRGDPSSLEGPPVRTQGQLDRLGHLVPEHPGDDVPWRARDDPGGRVALAVRGGSEPARGPVGSGFGRGDRRGSESDGGAGRGVMKLR
jgi:hypothetical protein